MRNKLPGNVFREGHLGNSGEKTFHHRSSHALPHELKAPPTSWERPFEEMAAECGLKLSISEAFEKVKKYFKELQKATG